MAPQHGVSATTPSNIIVDAGKVVVNYGEVGEALLGATRGGNSFSLQPEYREMEVDGAKGPVAGMRRITGVVATLTANMLELSTSILLRGIPGAASVVSGDHDVITRAIADLDSTDHLTNVALVGEVHQTTYPIICLVKNAIADGALEIATAHNDEGVVSLVFKAHFTTSDLATEPWEIRYPTS